MPTIALPKVNLNGTSKPELLLQQLTAMHAIDDAIAALQAAAPHGRDYQTLPKGTLHLALSEHAARLKMLRVVHEELQAIAVHINDS